MADIGNIDVRFSVDGIGDYEKVVALSEKTSFGDQTIRLLSLDGLIASKRAIARPQDQLALPELEMMRKARDVARGHDVLSLPTDEPAPQELIDHSEADLEL